MPINCAIKFKCGFIWPNNWVLKIFPFVKLVQEPLTNKIAVAYLCRPHLVHEQISECKASIFELAKLDESWFSRYQSHENIASMTSLRIMQNPAWLHQHSRYHWNFSFFCTDLSTHLGTISSTSNLSRILVTGTLVGGGIQNQPWKVVELQQHSPLSNNTKVTTYVHRMIILPPCLFKHMNDEHVAMLFQYLLDHTQQILYFCLISLLRNNVSKSV